MRSQQLQVQLTYLTSVKAPGAVVILSRLNGLNKQNIILWPKINCERDEKTVTEEYQSGKGYKAIYKTLKLNQTIAIAIICKIEKAWWWNSGKLFKMSSRKTKKSSDKHQTCFY